MALPAQLRGIQHHLRTAQEHEKRDPVVTYYCRLYAMQTGMKLDSKTPECRKFLVKLMDQLETSWLLMWSTSVLDFEVLFPLMSAFFSFNPAFVLLSLCRNMIKSFYTSSLLIDVLTVFGELSEEVSENSRRQKTLFMRQSSLLISCCLNDQRLKQFPVFSSCISDEFGAEGIGFSQDPGSAPGGQPASNYNNIQIPPGAHAPANTPAELPAPSEAVKPMPAARAVPNVDPSLFNAQQQGGVQLSPEDFTKAQKYCKYAGSALQYEDVGTAIQNLQKALKLLTTGKE
uniref:Vesicle (multivesicular body) trafficking 1 n=1 Tax=Cyprinodon variegatus TaxID=28743 RepID=A0A3Q2FWC4_CYPVA